jgi:pimeloyl-ACP methyl ester carboxylesterase
MATYVLVPGAGHGGWVYRRVAPLLRARGHDVYTPTLTGLGERSHLLGPDVDLDTHVEDIVNVLRFEDLGDVILAGHSYGGMVVTGVAGREPERIGHLVFLDAALPKNGESLLAHSPVIIGEAYRHVQVVNGAEVVLTSNEDTAGLHGVTDPGDLAWVLSKQTPHPWKTFSQPLRIDNEAAAGRIPRTNINCTPTIGVRPDENRHRLFEADRVWELDTGHCMMITEPEKTAELLLRLADL